MKTFELLHDELTASTQGAYAPDYFLFLGYRIDPAAAPATLRSNGIYSLFNQTTPVILKNEWIAGNTKALFTDAEPFVLNCAKRTVAQYSQRTFETNKDHFAPDYRSIVQKGIPGLMHDIDASIAVHNGDIKKTEYLYAMKRTVSGFKNMIQHHIEQAQKCTGHQGYNDERLDFIISNCNAILNAPPQSFAQALQLVWFCHVAFLFEQRYAMALGRLDQYLYPFFKADIDNGVLTEEFAIELLENIFIKLENDIVNICIGGQNPQGECEINLLSRCILRAVRSCNIPGPNLSLRYTHNTPDDFFDECLETIGTGLGYPAIMNDDVNIDALKQYGYNAQDVYDYSMVGCIENFITGMQPPWTDGRFDTPRFFDYVFNRGVSHTSGTIGLDPGKLEDIDSMEAFMKAFESVLAHGVAEYCARFRNANDRINQEHFPEPFLSCFCRDCIGRGTDINNGGSVYPSVHGACLMGIGTVSDSLAAIEKVVFIDAAATLSELSDAMNANFVGYEDLHQKLLAAPKYGNNNELVDKYAVWFVDYLASQFAQYKTRDGGRFYIAAAANVSNIYAGKAINATPDGRLRGEPLSDAASPTYGCDTRGATSAINSISKPDYTKIACGSVVNQKYSPSMFSGEKRKKLMALIKTYFKKGGQEIQINSTSREILEDAMEHPEKYPNLVVRVSGFSAFYISLAREVQLDILRRTQQE